MLSVYLHVVNGEPCAILRPGLGVHARSEVPGEPEKGTRVHVEQILLPHPRLVRAVLEEAEDPDRQHSLRRKILDEHGRNLWAVRWHQCRLPALRCDDVVDHGWQDAVVARHCRAAIMMSVLAVSLHLTSSTTSTTGAPIAVCVAPRLRQPQRTLGGGMIHGAATLAMGSMGVTLTPAAVALAPTLVLLVDTAFDEVWREVSQLSLALLLGWASLTR
mmetsp:Transcript_37877/g.100108  ORF Transcript_37877/g.100108 Transcript_37877/m.100108 type:complete len:217 (-) Transcript_37877:351-1001(-)